MAPDRDLGRLDILNLFAPSAYEEYHEWVDVLEAVEAAGETFTMIELGAGWGRWIVLAAIAARSIGKQVGTLTAVEAEPDHYAWTRQQFLDNGFDPGDHMLIRAAAAGEEGACAFYTGCADAWYGQSIAPGVRPTTPELGGEGDAAVRCERMMETVQQVPQVTLQSILRRYGSVDVLHSDIQGSELEVIEAAIEELTAKVRDLHRPWLGLCQGRACGQHGRRDRWPLHGSGRRPADVGEHARARERGPPLRRGRIDLVTPARTSSGSACARGSARARRRSRGRGRSCGRFPRRP
jgi:FkbM family methyltransferase